MTSPPRYRVECSKYTSGPFCCQVVDADGQPAIWQRDDKVGRVPLRFRTEALAQAAADG